MLRTVWKDSSLVFLEAFRGSTTPDAIQESQMKGFFLLFLPPEFIQSDFLPPPDFYESL